MQPTEFEQLLTETLAARDRSPQTPRETFTLMLWLFGRYLNDRHTGKILPEILSPQEVTAIFDTCGNLKHKTLLMTSYSGGLRLGETLGLIPSDIDSSRMMIRVEQGVRHRIVACGRRLRQPPPGGSRRP